MAIGLAVTLLAIAWLALGAAYAEDETPTVVDLLLSDPAASCDAVEPHIDSGAYDAVSGRHYVAAVWVQRRSLGEGCASGGDVRLRWAHVITQAAGWGSAVDPLQGLLLPNEMATHADVAVEGTTAHVLAVTRILPATGGDYPVTTTLRYVAYDMSTGSRTASALIRQDVAASASAMQLLEAAITVSDDGVPHVVYSRRTGLGNDVNDVSDIWYTRPLSGTWDVGVELTDGSRNNPRKAYHPQIAWSRSLTAPYQGYVHFTWGIHKAPTSDVSDYDGDVYYRRCLDNAVEGGTIVCGDETLYVDQTSNKTHPRPTIAAKGDTVALVWNQCVSLDPNPPCELFALIYRMSGRSGGDFAIQANNNVPPYEVISNNRVDFGSYSYKYVGTDDEGIEYGPYLRPTAVISPDGGLFVAWQIVSATLGGSDAHYWPSAITTTWGYSPSIDQGKFTVWQDRGWFSGDHTDARFIPDMAAAPLEAEPQGGFHILLMRSDDVNGEQRYRIYYTYFDEAFVPPQSGGGGNEDPYPYKIALPLIVRGS